MRPYPDASLLVASVLSITLHWGALITLDRAPHTGQASPTAPPLIASLRTAPPRPFPPALPKQRSPDRVPISNGPSDRQSMTRTPSSHQQSTDEAPSNSNAGAEVPFFPIEALSRPPVLLTKVGPQDWPSNPGAPSGRLLIQVDIDADGRVVRTTPVCTPYTCHAAATYAGFIRDWSFSPAEILGHPVPSRIAIEIELENPVDKDLEFSPLTPSQPPQ